MMQFWSYSLICNLFIPLSCFILPIHGLGGNETDQLALLQFKAKITDDPLGVFNSWNMTTHFCQWQGVGCSRRHQRVVMLALPSKKLVGSISPYIGNLSFLKELYLFNNSFSLEIPPEIGRLPRLQFLELHNNSLGGRIPTNISACSNLFSIRFGFNKLVGTIPVELGFLLKLKVLYMTSNNLVGTIPSSLGNLSALQVLFAPLNYLEGSIPDALGKLKSLTSLNLGINRLSGNIPYSIFNLSSITTFDVGINQLHGTLPSNLAITLPNLQWFSINSNQFSGSIPLSISNASNLVVVQIQANKFTGSVPLMEKLHKLTHLSITSNHLGSGGTNDLSFLTSLTNATKLKVLSINDNNLGGELPDSIGNYSTEIYYMTIDNNEIFGNIPAGIGNLINLERLDAWENHISGNIPFDIGKLQKLVVLHLFGNRISGKIPSSLGNLTNLSSLRLDRNNLQGRMPPSLAKCKNLRELALSQNNFSGTIPPELFSLSSLSIALYLTENQLIGSLPTEVGKLKNLGLLAVANNKLSGKIPRSLSNCGSLESLYMHGNFFEGSIPTSLSSLNGIQNLDLSRNNLSGEIPKFLAGFKLLYLNLSFNDFEGAVPIEGSLKNVSAVLVTNNSKLCGGVPELQLPRCNFKEHKSRTLTRNLKIVICVVSAILGVTIALSVFYFSWLRKKRKMTPSNSSENQFMKVSYGDLLKATDGFSSANMIGVGRFGSVYKGIFYQDRKIIAVKVLNLLRRGASKSFIAECEALRSIRHRNLVKVLTACSGVDYRGNAFKALVYEFMVNGSLEEWLHPILGTDESPRKLNFLQRLNIAIDVACALEYLHHHCQIGIVHCDLKPSNVLLDNEMIGHVGDFGLSKFLQEANNNLSTSQTSSAGIRGSVGYAPPEYGMGSEVSTNGDVYSYGILLLEMFTGKRPTEDMFIDGLNLHNLAKSCLPQRVVEIVDPILLPEIVDGDTSADNNNHRRSMAASYKIHEECLISIIEVGVACSAEFLGDRINISDVVAKLRVIKNKLLQSCIYGYRCTKRTFRNVDTIVILELN